MSKIDWLGAIALVIGMHCVIAMLWYVAWASHTETMAKIAAGCVK